MDLVANRLPYLLYPLLMLGAFAMHGLLSVAGWPLLAATQTPVVVVVLSILVLEKVFAERPQWRPQRGEVGTDLVFLAVVQGVLPQALAFLASLTLLEWVRAANWDIAVLWPHAWPSWLQAVMMVLIADFFRYWLHRACHDVPMLWRLHAVHHSPQRLYSLNVGRFHPLEKALQYLFDALPFIVLAVDPAVLALYFVFYATNGFLQHSNVRLRYGWLNYLISGAELHRWHHSHNPHESGTNFGNNTIVWDLLFGTWFLPSDRKVGALGVPDPEYPMSFWGQLAVPFRSAATRSVLPWWDRSLNFAIAIVARYHYRRYVVPLLDKAGDPAHAQATVLQNILSMNRNSEYGLEHGFETIADYPDFVEHVPVNDYEDLREVIVEQQVSGRPVLSCEAPVHYARTSGTTAEPKDIPITPSGLRDYRRQQRITTALQYRACPAAFRGRIFAIVGAAEEGKTRFGKRYGSASGLIHRYTPALFRHRYVVPPEVMTLEDHTLKYLLMLRLALACTDISYMGAANPSTFLRLMELFQEHQASLISDIKCGTFTWSDRIPDGIRNAVAHRMHPDPRRAAELRAMCAQSDEIGLSALWPNVRMLVTWGGASAGLALAAVRQGLHARVCVFELGYVASEFRGTITLDARSNGGLPTLDSVFFEFIDVEAQCSEHETPVCLRLHELELAGRYYLLVTSASGLYRYFINDIVEVTGFYRATPLLRFLQKGRGVTNLTGEKLHETHVVESLQSVTERHGIKPRFMLMVAQHQPAGYTLYLEPEGAGDMDSTVVRGDIEQHLNTVNIEYGQKRDSGRLAALRVCIVGHGTGEAFKASRIAAGQKEAQYKPPLLIYRDDLEFDIERYLEPRE